MSLTQIDLCAYPAAPSPDGKHNFENPPTLAPMMVSVSIILLAISITLTAIRTHISWKQLHSADQFALAACIFIIAFTGDILAQHKFNRHQWDVPVCWFSGTYYKIIFVEFILFVPVSITSKSAIFLLYKQIFGVQRYMKVAANVGLLFTSALYLPQIPVAAILMAPPAGQSWQSMFESKNPEKSIIWGLVQSSLTVLLDLYIFILPLPIILKLNMQFRRRLQLLSVFTTALVGIVASVVSLTYRIKLVNQVDTLWPQGIVSICALVEPNVAIIVSCMPAFARFWKLHISRSTLFGSLRSHLLNITGRGSGGSSGDGFHDDRQKIATFGSGDTPWRRNYYELTNSAFLRSQVTVQDHTPVVLKLPQNGVIRSVGLSQYFGDIEHDSNEHLTQQGRYR